MSGPGTPANTTQSSSVTNKLPGWMKPYQQDLLQRSSDISKTPYTPYTGQAVAGLTPQHQSAINMIQQRAQNGSPLIGSATNQIQGTLGGDYFNKTLSNPMLGLDNKYLQGVIDNSNSDITRAFTNGTMPQTDASFARSGAFGGSAWQQANAENNRQLASELAKNTTGLRYQDYTNQQNLYQQDVNAKNAAFDAERNRQMQALGQAQPLANQAYTDAQQLMGAGDIQRDYQQALNDWNYQQFQNQLNQPYKNLDALGNALHLAMGAGGTTNSTSSAMLPRVNPATSLIGGGLAGAGLGSAIGSAIGNYGTQGAAVGGGLGALAGLLG